MRGSWMREAASRKSCSGTPTAARRLDISARPGRSFRRMNRWLGWWPATEGDCASSTAGEGRWAGAAVRRTRRSWPSRPTPETRGSRSPSKARSSTASTPASRRRARTSDWCSAPRSSTPWNRASSASCNRPGVRRSTPWPWRAGSGTAPWSTRTPGYRPTSSKPHPARRSPSLTPARGRSAGAEPCGSRTFAPFPGCSPGCRIGTCCQPGMGSVRPSSVLCARPRG